MNAVGPWFGCMPCCHGAGGLAAQVRFGARSGAAPMLLGAVTAVAGVLFGSSLFELLRRFPEPLLGVMLLFSGCELACTASKLPSDKPQWCVPRCSRVLVLHCTPLLSACLCALLIPAPVGEASTQPLVFFCVQSCLHPQRLARPPTSCAIPVCPDHVRLHRCPGCEPLCHFAPSK
jgi:hypothetical protein